MSFEMSDETRRELSELGFWTARRIMHEQTGLFTLTHLPSKEPIVIDLIPPTIDGEQVGDGQMIAGTQLSVLPGRLEVTSLSVK